MKTLYVDPHHVPRESLPTLPERITETADQLERLADQIRAVRHMVTDGRPALANRLSECEISARILVLEMRRDVARAES